MARLAGIAYDDLVAAVIDAAATRCGLCARAA
jgi:hypothetical protein